MHQNTVFVKVWQMKYQKKQMAPHKNKRKRAIYIQYILYMMTGFLFKHCLIFRQRHRGNIASRAARKLKCAVPGAPPKKETFMGILAASESLLIFFCEGVTVQFRGPCDSLMTLTYYAGRGQPHRGEHYVLRGLSKSRTKNFDQTWGLRVQRKTKRLIKTIAVSLRGFTTE